METRPQHDQIIVKRIDGATPQTFTRTAIGTSTRGEVLLVGSGHVLENGDVQPLPFNVGDTVIFMDGYGVKTGKLNGEPVLFLSESDILAVL